MKATIDVEASLACVRMYGTATTTHLARTHVIVVCQIRFVLIPRNHPSLSISECRSIIDALIITLLQIPQSCTNRSGRTRSLSFCLTTKIYIL